MTRIGRAVLHLANGAALIVRLGGRVERFRLHAEVLTGFHKFVELYLALKYRVDCLVHDLHGGIKVLLDLGDLISFGWVLVFNDGLVESLKWQSSILFNGWPLSSILCLELIKKLRHDRKRDTLRVLCICHNHNSETIGAKVCMHVVSLVLHSLTLARGGPLDQRARNELDKLRCCAPLEKAIARELSGRGKVHRLLGVIPPSQNGHARDLHGAERICVSLSKPRLCQCLIPKPAPKLNPHEVLTQRLSDSLFGVCTRLNVLANDSSSQLTRKEKQKQRRTNEALQT
mmetsp:Transcript_16191/g.31330  ORF Transcript_16191/g.31330 Transcript_16191/m.31330 type:complete len:287 (+) Transcript_16191:367-1227(+)